MLILWMEIFFASLFRIFNLKNEKYLLLLLLELIIKVHHIVNVYFQSLVVMKYVHWKNIHIHMNIQKYIGN
jgi:hypothetical protein